MSLLTSTQGKINNIFTKIGSTVSRTPYASQTEDKWGDSTITYDNPVSVTAIPYSLFTKKEDFQPFADLQSGDVVMVFKHDQALNEKDKITFDSVVYYVKEIETFPFADGNLAKIVRLVASI